DVAVAAGHLKELTIALRAAVSFLHFHLPPADFKAALAQRNHEESAPRVVTHGLPVVAAFRARARADPVADLGFDDVAAVRHRPRLRVDRIEDVLEDRFLVAEELARLTIELPQDAGLADGEHQLPAVDVHEHALEYFVEIERFAGCVLEEPRQLPGVG